MVQAGRRSTTKKSNRGRKPLQLLNQHAQAVIDMINVPDQEPDKKKSHYVFMITSNVMGLIESDQTGKLPRISDRVIWYICVFYIYDANAIRAIPIKS